MKQKRFFLTISIFFVVMLLLSVYIPSRDNFSNRKNGLENKQYALNDIGMIDWIGTDGEYLHNDSSQIILNNVNCYVHSIKIAGQLIPGADEIKFYYTSQPEENFTEEKSKTVTCGVGTNNICFTADVTAASLRIDLAGEAGTELILKYIELNDDSPVFSINNIAKYCLLPVMLFGGLLFLILYRVNLLCYFSGLRRYLPMVGNLISRDLKVKYRRSVLGFLWSILNPLLMALVTNAVFAKIFRFQVEYFATYYLTGLLIFNFVVECTTNSLMSIIGASTLIRKVYVPKYIFPLQKCAFAFVNMLFGGVAVVVVMLIQGVSFHATALLCFVPMLYAFVFSYGLGLILAAFTVYFRDIQHLYSVFTSIWMYLTPIIYPEEILLSSGLGIVMKLNPMYYLVHSFRELVIYGQLPSLNENIMCIVFATISLLCGLTIFKKLQDRFILYI